MKTKLAFKLKQLRITSPSTASGITGEALSLTLTANYPIADWGIESGDNSEIDGDGISLVVVSSPGDFPQVVVATDIYGRTVRKTITLSLTGAAAIGQVTGLTATALSPTEVELDWTNVAGAVGYQASVNNDDGNPRDLVLPKPSKIGILDPDTLYNFKARGHDGGAPRAYGAWSVVASATTFPVDDPPPVGVQAKMADSVCSAVMMNLHCSFAAATSPWRTSTGWITDHFAAMAAAGGGRLVRTSVGSATAASQAAQQLNLMYNNYGTKALVELHQALTDSPDIATVVKRVRDNIGGPKVGAWESLNEVNDGFDAPTWPQDTLAHMDEVYEEVRRYSDFNDSKIACATVYGRRTTTYDTLLAAGWAAHANKFDVLNGHIYTGGRKPTFGGAPSGTVDENGDPVDEVSLDFTLADLQRMKVGAPIWITENGWNYYNTRPPSAFLVSEEAQAKYQQRFLFECLNRGVAVVDVFEFIDNYTDNTKVYGLLKYSSTNGPFTRRPSFNTMLRTLEVFNDPGVAFTPGVLNYSLSGTANQDIHHALYQRRNGKFLIPVWNDFSSWSRSSPGNVADNIAFKDGVQLNLGQSVSSVRKIRPYLSNSYSAVGTNISNTVQTIPDDALIFEVTV